MSVYDTTIRFSEAGAFDSVQEIQTFCTDNRMESGNAMMIALSVEEMISYTLDSHLKKEDDHLDILLKIHGKNVMVYFRSIGEPFHPAAAPDGKFSNLDVLRKLAKSVDFSYVMGMNQTRVILSF